MDALSPLGMVSDNPSELHTESCAVAQKDYFVEKDGVKFAGTHLLLDLWGASNLTDPELIDRALRDAAEAANATILHSHFHHFGPDGGVSGVVVLAESHISIDASGRTAARPDRVVLYPGVRCGPDPVVRAVLFGERRNGDR